jgi:biotin carboxyl carrier protein
VSEPGEVETIARLMEMAARFGLEELEVEEEGLKVRLRAAPMGAGPEDAEGDGERAFLWRLPPWPAPESEPASPTRPETARPLLAPLTGIFYRAEAPGGPFLVEVGQTVEEGSAIGLIEAMKVFSPIPADRAGVIIEIVAQNAQLVHHGDVLLYIDPA